MALWRNLGTNRACNSSPEASKASVQTTETCHSRSKRPKRLSSSLKCTRREGLRDCTNRLTASYNASRREGYVPPYQWFCPERPLLERRCRTDQRREELLQLLYLEEDSVPDQIDDLVTEWVSLLVERDKLLHEQVNKEICTEYFRELHRLLRAQPSLGNTSKEINIREVLMDFERCVTEYCRERNILTASQRPLNCSNTFAKPMFFHPPPDLPEGPTMPQCIEETRKQSKGHLLDQETGQASVHIEVALTQGGKSPPLEDDSSGSLFKEAAAEIPVSECLHVNQPPIVTQSGIDTSSTHGSVIARLAESTRVAGQGLFNSHCTHPLAIPSGLEEMCSNVVRKPAEPSGVPATHTSSTVVPPPRPILPPAASTSPPPLPPSPPPPHQETISPTHRVMPIKAGVTGTVQFAGMATSALPAPRQSVVTTWKKRLFGFGKDEPDKGVPAPTSVRKEDRKNLLDEISSMGHAGLKRTNRPRSPGGTPVKATRANPPPVGNNSDMLQRALMTKFRSLHSTPLNQSRFVRQDFGASMDFSNAWSDINASQVFEDPDISASSLSGLASNQPSRNDSSKISTAHNGSSAV